MIRSTTDEILAARHDPEPYAGADGRRYANPFDMAVGVFAPRVEYIPSRDPKPWDGNTATPVQPDENRFDFEQGHELVLNDMALEWAPRPEYARPEPNPILVRLRAIAERDGMHVHEYAPSFLPGNIWQWAEVGTPEQIMDARNVVTRLVGVFA